MEQLDFTLVFVYMFLPSHFLTPLKHVRVKCYFVFAVSLFLLYSVKLLTSALHCINHYLCEQVVSSVIPYQCFIHASTFTTVLLKDSIL